MPKDEKKLMREVFNEGFEQLILPHFEKIYNEMATKKELALVKEELKHDINCVREELTEEINYVKDDVDQINRKLDAEIEWKDEAAIRLQKLELKTGISK